MAKMRLFSPVTQLSWSVALAHSRMVLPLKDLIDITQTFF
uniref:Uncharacterized protein n=1 Tax=Anguilla anguilla TaxID=7936 RepID=A0A0E9PSP2_ANGAN